MISSGSNQDPGPLVEARKLLDETIRPMDSAYAEVMPDVYKRALDIENHLYPKLDEAARAWARNARTNIIEYHDYETGCQYLEYSLSLWDDPHVREELRDARRMLCPDTTSVYDFPSDTLSAR